MTIREISPQQMQTFVTENHYSTTMPRITKACYGGFQDDSLRAAISFGWGSRPRHTIQRIFPSLDTADYLEIGKMCVHDDEPRNTESQFIAETFWRLRQKFSNLSLVFTWADGLWGKPGYVYQASNFLYGGFIWTDVYQMEDGRRLHPLQIQSVLGKFGLKTVLRTQRPTFDDLTRIGWKRLRGKQFRYVLFLCADDLKKQLRLESPFAWTTNYPKHSDLEWKVQTAKGTWADCTQPHFTGTL